MGKSTPEQQKVIDTHSGTVLVRACPGSGKTTTLVERCKALPPLETKLVLAFNKKAAEDFKARMGSVAMGDVRTFHSFCFREVMNGHTKFGFSSKPTLAEDSFFSMLKQATGERCASWDDSPWNEDYCKQAENSLYDHDLEKDRESHEEGVADSAAALLSYRKWLIARNSCTFDSMVRLCAEHADKLGFAAKHLMVDEYQDVDRFQFDIVQALASNEKLKSLVCVGDPNQRIYEWRGALADAFATMQNRRPETVTLPLTTNFRSLDGILRHAEEVCPVGMSGVRGDSPESVQPAEGNVIRQLTGRTDFRHGDDLSHYAILCRYNRDCLMWQLQLAREHVPVHLLGQGDFWNAKHIRLAKLARGKGDRMAKLETYEEWRKLMQKTRDEDRRDEMTRDAAWVLALEEGDLKLLERNMQAPKGLRIATIHKTKGMEFDRVLVSGISEKLRAETFVYYVAVTRAKNNLILG